MSSTQLIMLFAEIFAVRLCQYGVPRGVLWTSDGGIGGWSVDEHDKMMKR